MDRTENHGDVFGQSFSNPRLDIGLVFGGLTSVATDVPAGVSSKNKVFSGVRPVLPDSDEASIKSDHDLARYVPCIWLLL